MHHVEKSPHRAMNGVSKHHAAVAATVMTRTIVINPAIGWQQAQSEDHHEAIAAAVIRVEGPSRIEREPREAATK
ncbi:hypothetical protein CEE69_12145 [Rhodopirellula bahusiensis]|uniref:Uncharacterized protein n=1 Tax=Rhodopirellula bahusiensis TaxID=2014065 RepID=A0A2G1W7Z2_9BACT|nr:hypothetical protein CEE69_12145 [Rhodopirellula bahusiensis]